ncbi:hypothetical protein VitviT2T_003500 [Vitis vinifera]|uniref:TF-B3 domain-containing protein n=1 Tax=Vitis vinifera TaxID=29760 RepID=A0ABY9BNK2_VITVI|nr:B3 domain-containing protein Os01g0234100 isoform X1 [Vitis vinifera]XP_059591882.1 B3 domain-containing protein Os01g0234100 isoform X1 [Vitis vinifera]XP_059591883.1 B3 domain-containing protein Os01g0234100 isoform X1 [Vitis vinifera]XP_059591884.1 B3 domain-containing protein Os01g0234100 isoform X1 [Vitis vinifera]XP_059591885.1 B3 domain-containing protein Os01g0234100 isoform X1 [Vitis vinifera]XP_059591886.1 B3 domain-containing protein Os01g0234100 isoform X1 [Vitis vinifera]XP_05
MAVVEEEKVKVKDEVQQLKQRTSEMKRKPSAKRTCPEMKRHLDHTQKIKKEVSDAQQKATSCKRIRVDTDHITNGNEAKSSVMERAEKVQRNLPSEIPSMIKSMLPSHVTGGFWLGLPKKFCDVHLPKYDTTIILVDKRGAEYKTKFLVGKTGLSGGWRGFSIAHNLLEGDVLVFGLVQPTKFMVYIVRTNGFDEVDGAPLVLLNLEACVKQEDFDLAGEDIKRWKNGEVKCLKNCLPNSPQENTKKESLSVSTTELGLAACQSENDSDGHGSEVLERIRFSESAVDFKEVKSMEAFSILVNGLIINSEFSKHLQTKYYELCCSQKTYLHDHLLDGLNYKLAAGIISETVNIADAIRASKLTTSRDNFSIWSKTLKAFQELGMNVGFLRARLDQLMSFGFVENRKREARLERVSAEEKIRDLEGSLLHVKEVRKRLNAEIEALDSPAAEKHELMFQELAKSSW